MATRKTIKTADALKNTTAIPPLDTPPPSAGHNQPPAGDDYQSQLAAIATDVRNAIDAVLTTETSAVKANQKVALDILRYRAVQLANGIKLVPWDKMVLGRSGKGMEAKEVAYWRRTITEQFIGKRPKVKGDLDDKKASAVRNYNKRMAVIHSACDFCLAAGPYGLTVNDWVTTDDGGYFAVAVKALLPKDKPWLPILTLADYAENDKPVPLDNTGYSIKSGKGYRDINASVKQCITAFKSKPPKAGETGDGEDDDEDGDGESAKPGNASNTGSIDPKVRAHVLKTADIGALFIAVWDTFQADTEAKLTAAMFSTDTWNLMVRVANKITAMSAKAANQSGIKPVAVPKAPARKRA